MGVWGFPTGNPESHRKFQQKTLATQIGLTEFIPARKFLSQFVTVTGKFYSITRTPSLLSEEIVLLHPITYSCKGNTIRL